MSLQAKLDAHKARSAEVIPAEARAIMARVTEDLKRSGLVDGVLQPGDMAPAFILEKAHGEQVDSTSRLPMVLSFYRGVW